MTNYLRKESVFSMDKAYKIVADTLRNSDSEGTSAPWWTIIDPKQNMNCDPHTVGFNIVGPFFSREDAENFLSATRYNFSKRAVVYCNSGCYSKKYVDFYNDVKNEK